MHNEANVTYCFFIGLCLNSIGTGYGSLGRSLHD